jgi:hypothetical protein
MPIWHLVSTSPGMLYWWGCADIYSSGCNRYFSFFLSLSCVFQCSSCSPVEEPSFINFMSQLPCTCSKCPPSPSLPGSYSCTWLSKFHFHFLISL